jgi:hypothetical protein
MRSGKIHGKCPGLCDPGQPPQHVIRTRFEVGVSPGLDIFLSWQPVRLARCHSSAAATSRAPARARHPPLQRQISAMPPPTLVAVPVLSASLARALPLGPSFLIPGEPRPGAGQIRGEDPDARRSRVTAAVANDWDVQPALDRASPARTVGMFVIGSSLPPGPDAALAAAHPPDRASTEQTGHPVAACTADCDKRFGGGPRSDGPANVPHPRPREPAGGTPSHHRLLS